MQRCEGARVLVVLALAVAPLFAQNPASWTAPQAPLRIWANVYYVGTRGLSAILVTSDQGHVLIDAALAESAPAIAANIRALGFRVEDVELILNSHAHFDHAGGIAELQRLSRATVAALPPSARVLEDGRSGPDDPQFGLALPMTPVSRVRRIADREVLRVGPLALTAHATGGHTPGGTTWSWRSCEGARCLNFVYADSLTAVATDGFSFTRSTTYPTAVQDFERSFERIAGLPCDILLTPHPEFTGLWDRVAKRDQGVADALVDEDACRRYADRARAGLKTRIDREASAAR